jgi:hypothetical protein
MAGAFFAKVHFFRRACALGHAQHRCQSRRRPMPSRKATTLWENFCTNKHGKHGATCKKLSTCCPRTLSLEMRKDYSRRIGCQFVVKDQFLQMFLKCLNPRMIKMIKNDQGRMIEMLSKTLKSHCWCRLHKRSD